MVLCRLHNVFRELECHFIDKRHKLRNHSQSNTLCIRMIPHASNPELMSLKVRLGYITKPVYMQQFYIVIAE